MNAPDERGDFQFTPAAEAALQNALKEIAAEIGFRAAANAHKGSRETALIGVLDVADALSETRGKQNGISRRLRSLFLATGAYGVIGISLLFYSLGVNREPFPVLPIIAALLIGTAIPSITYWFLTRLDNRRASARGEDTAEGGEIFQIFHAWLEIESVIRTYYGRTHGESRASAPIAEMVRVLLADQAISPETASKIERLRKVRNSLVHERDLKLTRKEVRDLVKDAESVLNEFQRLH